MNHIPSSVLSEHFQRRLVGKRIHSAVFLTFRFDPGFFEQEILPVLLDLSTSHVPELRLMQLEQELARLQGEMAVYYDTAGLPETEIRPAKLDIQRIAIRLRQGIFHPKNVLLLVEPSEPDDRGRFPQSLIVASMSANLTRAGWWENVEACHVEELPEGALTSMRDDLIRLLERVRRLSPRPTRHAALDEIRAFLQRTTQRQQKTRHGLLLPHLYRGEEALADFLDRLAGPALRGATLELISPYFDRRPASSPLHQLIERFQPREVRVFLPRNAAGEALCEPELFKAVEALPGVQWGCLPKDLTSFGRSKDAAERLVHAKIYRFYKVHPKQEWIFVGSANLTAAAHHGGRNVETGFLVELEPDRRPQPWLQPLEHPPTRYRPQVEGEAPATAAGSPLSLRYHWQQQVAHAYWDDPHASGPVRITASGVPVFELPHLEPRQLTELPAEAAAKLASVLASTSFVRVHVAQQPPVLLLVQETGMVCKPSQEQLLSTDQILRYWALLNVEQRAAFIEARGPELLAASEGSELTVTMPLGMPQNSLFTRFAGIFQAFARLETDVQAALVAQRDKQAAMHLFGRFASLKQLLERLQEDHGVESEVERYVTALCAEQLCRRLDQAWPAFRSRWAPDLDEVQARIDLALAVRARLETTSDMRDFLDWFEPLFLGRATSAEVNA